MPNFATIASAIARAKWFVLACCFLLVNLYGASRRPSSGPIAADGAAKEWPASEAGAQEPRGSEALAHAPAASPPAERAAVAARPPEPGPLVVIGIQAESPPFGEPWIRVRLSHPVDPAAFRRSATLTPAADVSVEMHRDHAAGHYAELRGDLRKGNAYALTIRDGLASRDGTARLSKDVERVVAMPDAPPAIRVSMPGRYLSPRGSLRLPMESVNVESYTLTAARIPAHNLVQYAMREGGRYRGFYGRPDEGIRTGAARRDFAAPARKNTVVRHGASLRELLPEDPCGAYVIDLAMDKRNISRRLLVISDIGIVAKQSPGELLVWANSLHTLEAASNATVKAWSSAAVLLAEGRTDSRGLARLATRADKGTRPFMITVENGADLAFLDIGAATAPVVSAADSREYLAEGYEVYLYADRGVYRPGETAHVRAIVRGRHLAMPDKFPVDLEALRPDGRRHSLSSAVLSKAGTAEFSVPWSDFDATGRYALSVKLPGSDRAIGSLAVAVEEFAPPLIAATAQTDRPQYSVGETGRVAVSARYLYGAPAAGNSVSARLMAYPVAFASAHYPDYVFGDAEKTMSELSRPLGMGRLDAHGNGELSFEIADGWQPPSMARGLLTVSVSDEGGRAVTAYAHCDIHAYPHYIGLLRKGPSALRPGDDLLLALAVVGTDGAPSQEQRRLEADLYSVRWNTVLTQETNGRWRYRSERTLNLAHSRQILTHADGQAETSLRIGAGGAYRVAVRDPATGASSSLEFFVGSEHDRWQTRSMEHPGRLRMELDKASYRPGDTARLHIVAPFSGKVLLTVEQDRVLHAEVRSLAANSGTFEIPVGTNLWPNAHVHATLIRAVEPSAMQQVYRAMGTIPLRLDTSEQRLRVAIAVPEEVRPGSLLEPEIRISGPDGQGRQAEFTLAAIDEGICALTDFRLPDPLAYFSTVRRSGSVHADLYAMLLAETDDELVSKRSHTGGDIGSLLRGRLHPVRSRRFKPLALWHGAAMTDADGLARVSLALPEFSGQVRLMVVAVDGRSFGRGQAHVRVARPVTIQPSLPRFLAPGDTCQITVGVHNGAGEETEFTLAIATEGPVRIVGQASSAFRLAANERAQKRYALQALAAAGTARITFRAAPGGERYEETVELPVRPPAPRGVLSATATVPPGEQRDIHLPDEWLDGSASFSLLLSERPAAKLKGALDYLLRYPHGCLEQTVSASFPLLHLEEMQDLFNDNIRIVDLSPMVAAGIGRILSMQHHDGSFGYWPSARARYEWGSVYAMDFLVEAGRNGFPVPADNLAAGLNALRRILSGPVRDAGNVGSPEWSEDAALRAYVCRVLAQAGHPRHDWNARLLEQADFLDADTRLQLVLALAAGGRRRDAWNALTAPDRVAPASPPRKSGSLVSPARTAALRLMALAELAPEDPRTIEAMQRLESLKSQGGAWRTTQENAMAFVAFARYMRAVPKTEHGFRGRLEHAGRQTAFDSDGKSAFLAIPSGGRLTVVNEGPAQLYAAWQASGVPLRPMKQHASGIRIERAFFDLDGKRMEEHRATQGELMIVQLTVDASGTLRDHLVIEELLPAGLEIENARLSAAPSANRNRDATTMSVRHLDIRDDRLVVFPEALAGRWTFRYSARAVTPGTFALPPAAVEAMYDPAVASRAGAGTFIVESW